MSTAPTLPLSQIVNVIVEVSPQSPAQPTFNQGLIVGSSNVIPASQRVREYLSAAAMLSDGFTTNSPEYLAASFYFGQLIPPQVLWVGRQDLSAITAAILDPGFGGTGYQVGDVLTLVQVGASGGTVTVTTIGTGGAVTGIALTTSGTGYAVATGLSATGGHGTGAEFNITSVGESALAALTACRTANFQWWACTVLGAVKADHQAIAAYIQSATPFGMYFYTTADADALAGTAGNIFQVLKAASYNRVYGIYATTQSGFAPNNIYASAAVMGCAMGLNTGLANSYFTFKFKTLIGVIPESLSITNITNIENNNGNVYLSYANAYTFQEQGKVANGQFADEILNLDMLSSAIQYGIMNLLTASPAVPLTDVGGTQLIGAVNEACENARQRGFLAPGVWNGVQIINLSPGDPLPSGYVSQCYPYSQQTQADRQARKAQPIYTAIHESGAVHSVLIGVYVQR
jgi:Protein of unknown function (DUF3383)